MLSNVNMACRSYLQVSDVSWIRVYAYTAPVVKISHSLTAPPMLTPVPIRVGPPARAVHLAYVGYCTCTLSQSSASTYGSACPPYNLTNTLTYNKYNLV